MVLTPATSAVASTEVHLGGSWVEELSCLPTEATPDQDLATAHITCIGSSTWQGGWTGQTEFTAEGTVDLATGAITGTATETFTGVYTGDGSVGTLTFAHVVTSDATGWFHVDGIIVGGTGDFAGSSGSAHFDGYFSLFGGYAATWYR